MSETTNIDRYAEWAEGLWFASGSREFGERDYAIASLGLAGEVGEVMELLKKRVRDGNFDVEGFTKEMGDVIYYWSRLCLMFGVRPSDVLAANMRKLEDRRARGVMRGSGNDR